MSKLTYKLKQDLLLPATGNPSKGYLLFPKTEFGLSYQSNPNPRKKTMSVLLGVADIFTDEIVWPLTIYEITEDGFLTSQMSNQDEIDAYNNNRHTLEDAISSLIINIQQKEQEIQSYIDQNLPIQEYSIQFESVPQILKDELQSMISSLNTLNTELLNLVSPEPIPIYINKYDDVIGYFKGDGSLTEEGVQWARSVYYNGILIGDLIE